jgi:hypothetical protein
VLGAQLRHERDALPLVVDLGRDPDREARERERGRSSKTSDFTASGPTPAPSMATVRRRPSRTRAAHTVSLELALKPTYTVSPRAGVEASPMLAPPKSPYTGWPANMRREYASAFMMSRGPCGKFAHSATSCGCAARPPTSTMSPAWAKGCRPMMKSSFERSCGAWSATMGSDTPRRIISRRIGCSSQSSSEFFSIPIFAGACCS